MITLNQQRALRISQKNNVSFDPLWNINSAYHLGDDPDFNDGNKQYEWNKKHNSPKQNYDAIKELELFGMVILTPTGNPMDYTKDTPDPTYHAQITSEGLQWQEKAKGQNYDPYFDKC
jgi:hypothetical protein